MGGGERGGGEDGGQGEGEVGGGVEGLREEAGMGGMGGWVGGGWVCGWGEGEGCRGNDEKDAGMWYTPQHTTPLSPLHFTPHHTAWALQLMTVLCQMGGGVLCHMGVRGEGCCATHMTIPKH